MESNGVKRKAEELYVDSDDEDDDEEFSDDEDCGSDEYESEYEDTPENFHPTTRKNTAKKALSLLHTFFSL